ncbi:MAG: tRNA (N6-isopentenyl adenosine(37)-C2)-methylthiotransferase MiaB [Clostridiales bacterium]|jgi:tRNA-2-methylthio-N6-dimethylallyladenosine synthase|nr:tRNA (N6-isopentenyl adenosine(37)-C2)-methylthiotransferase MiaB [Clostridiales bacterium]
MRYHIVTYGCQMNVHESEKIAGVLKKEGYEAADSIDGADLIVFNTCCIRDTAEKRALGNIGALKKRKKSQKELLIAVLGCMTQQKGFGESLRETYPFVDIVLGTNNLHLLPYYIRLKKPAVKIETDDTYDVGVSTETFRTSYPNAWVNIMYGCNNFCSYCIVPYVRGREISREPQEVLREIAFLLGEGYKEITLLGQNVNSYRYGDTDFAGLLREIDVLPQKFRLRFMTSHPKDLSPEAVEIIRDSAHICKSIHLPVQTGSDRILKLMNRKYTAEHYAGLVKLIKERIDGVLVTTDLMIGFPTETEDDFQDTLRLVRECEFAQAFTFVYSPRLGTVSAEMPDLDAETKKRRITELIRVQNKISKSVSETFTGKICEVLIEGTDSGGRFVGRTDNGRLVAFPQDGEYKIGDFVSVKISASKSASLVGEIV